MTIEALIEKLQKIQKAAPGVEVAFVSFTETPESRAEHPIEHACSYTSVVNGEVFELICLS